MNKRFRPDAGLKLEAQIGAQLQNEGLARIGVPGTKVSPGEGAKKEEGGVQSKTHQGEKL